MAVSNTSSFNHHCLLCRVNHPEDFPVISAIKSLVRTVDPDEIRFREQVVVIDSEEGKPTATLTSRRMIRGIQGFEGMDPVYAVHLAMLISHFDHAGIIAEYRDPNNEYSVHLFNFV